MMIKYRVSEVAKDFDAPSKEVIELLGKFVDTPKTVSYTHLDVYKRQI